MIYYVDTSALVKRYLNETGSQWLRRIFLAVNNARDVFIMAITGVEMSAALARKLRLGEIFQSVYQSALDQFEKDFRCRYSRIRVTYAVVARAMDVTKRRPLRAYDAIQLAGALELKTRIQAVSRLNVTFLSADNTPCQVAALEGLLVENPNNYP
jgi:hypothetical protein